MAAWSDASSGDLRPGRGSPASGRGGGLGRWAAEVTGDRGNADVRQVRWVDQVHGSSVVTVVMVEGAGGAETVGADEGAGVRAPAGDRPGRIPVVAAGVGDALVSTVPTVALAVLTADCASVALGSREGVFAAVHAGWRGLAEGVVHKAVRAMRDLGATEVVGALGPCIHPGCYEFSPSDLAEVCAAVGPEARGRTSDGRPALDIPAAVSAMLTACQVREAPGVGACTGCDDRYFSHRRRGDLGRQALLVWSEPSRGETPGPVGR